MIDPPWPIKWNYSKTLKTKQLQYKTMPISEIIQLPIDSIIDSDCLLLMWVTNAFLPEGLGIIRHWKFHYEKLFTWCKTNGMGGHPRNATEHIIMATRGNYPKKLGKHDQAIMNWIITPPQRKHSYKPKEIIDVLEKFTAEPRLELFAREKREGWDVWGDEVESDIEIKSKRGEYWRWPACTEKLMK